MKVQIVGEGRAVALLLPSRGEGLHPALASVVLPSGCALVVVSFVTIRVASPTDDDLERVEDLVFNHECAGVIAYSGASRIALGGLQAALPTVCLGGDALPLTLPGGGRPHLIYGDEDPVMAMNQRAIGTGAYDVSRCTGGHTLADYVRAEALSRALTILGVVDGDVRGAYGRRDGVAERVGEGAGGLAPVAAGKRDADASLESERVGEGGPAFHKLFRDVERKVDHG